MADSTAQPSRLMALGMFVFELRTAPFEQIARHAAWRWAGKERAGGPPAHQYVGRGDETLTIDGVLMPELTGGGKQIDTLRKMADEGKAWILLSGEGAEIGKYFIEQVEDKSSRFLSNGAPRKIEFSLSLKRYWEDEQTAEGGTGASMLGDLKQSLPDAAALQSAAATAVGDLTGKITDATKEAVGRLGGALQDVAGVGVADVAGAFSKAAVAARMLPEALPGAAAAKLTRLAAAAEGLAKDDITAIGELLRDTPAARSLDKIGARLDRLSGGMAAISQHVRIADAADALQALGGHIAGLLPIAQQDEEFYDP